MTQKNQPTGISSVVIAGLTVLAALVWMIAADRISAAPIAVTVSGTTTCNNGVTERTVAGTMTSTCGSGWSVGSLPPAQVIFSENFDAQADWYATGENCGITQPSANCPNSDVPPNWSYYRNADDLWRPDNGYPSNQYGQRISGDVKRGVSGKSWIKSSEANRANQTDSNYYSDSILMKKFDAEYSEMYLEFWILTQPSWQWQTGDGGKRLKLARIGHVDDIVSGDIFNIGTEGNSGPLYIFDFYNHDTYGWQNAHAPRCDPQDPYYLNCNTVDYTNQWTLTDYYDCREGQTCTGWIWSVDQQQKPTFEESIGDGNWHKIGLYVKMNSTVGVQDGIYRFYLDDRMEFEETGVPYRVTGSPDGTGWNFISIGGNWNNWYDAQANQSEQWYAIDDVRVCSTELCQ